MVTDTLKIEKFETLLCEVVGGREVIEMLNRHHDEGASYRTLADEHDIPRATVHRTLTRAKATLRRLSLLPKQWERTR